MKKLLALIALTLSLSTATAEPDYPNKPVRLVMGFAPGGATDVIARAISEGLSRSMSNTFFVENKPGANGVLLETQFVKVKPDGYTLLMTLSSHVTNLLFHKNLPFGMNDFQPISMVATSPFVLVSNTQFKPSSIRELIELAKREELSYASPGPGSTQHLAMELMNAMAGVKMTHVAYKGGAPALSDVLGGHVPITLLTPTSSLAYIRDGKLKPIAVTPIRRLNVLPGVPTVSEAGLTGYEADVWFGVLAPAGTPKPIVDKLNAALVALFKTPEMIKTLTGLGAVSAGTSPEEFAALMDADYKKWGEIIRKNNLKAE